MIERDKIREIRNQIAGIKPFTKFRIEENHLIVSAPGGLLPEQSTLCKQYRSELIELFTTPPGRAICARGHDVSWMLDESGIWLCAECADACAAKLAQLAPASQVRTVSH